MKNSTFLRLFFFLVLLVQNPEKLHSQEIVSIKTIPEPPTVGAPFQLEVWTYYQSGSPGQCYSLWGYVLDSNSTTLEITVYQNTGGVYVGSGCYEVDTFQMPVLKNGVEKIIVNIVEVHGMYNPPDTLPMQESDTLYLSQIGLPQNGEAKGFEVYPIPAKDRITINALKTGPLENLEMLDLSGRKVLNVAHFDPQEILHLPNLPAGIYFLQFEQSGAVFREKILIR